MKKLLTVVTVLCMMLVLAACSEKTQQNMITGYKTGDVTLGQYKGLTYTPMDVSVTEEEIDAKVDDFMASKAEKIEITDRTDVQDGDIANIDYCGRKDGVAFDGGTAQGYDLTIGSKKFIEGFESGLIGKNVGETAVLDLTFPEDYHVADLAGQAVQFEVTINSISVSEIPELTDEFIAANTAYENIEAYREYVAKSIKSDKESDAEEDKTYQVVQAAIEAATFNKNLSTEIDKARADMVNQYNSMYMQYYGMSAAEVYAALYGLDESAFNDYIYDMAESNTKYAYLTSAIAEEEKFTASDAEIGELANRMLASYGYSSVDELYTALKQVYNVDGKKVVAEQVKLNKAAEILQSTAVAMY